MKNKCNQCSSEMTEENIPVVSLNVNGALLYEGEPVCYQCAKKMIDKHVGGSDVGYLATFNAREEW